MARLGVVSDGGGVVGGGGIAPDSVGGADLTGGEGELGRSWALPWMV